MDIINCGYCQRGLGTINEIIANDVPAGHMCFSKYQSVSIDRENKMYGVDEKDQLKDPVKNVSSTISRAHESSAIKNADSRPGTSFVSCSYSQSLSTQSMKMANTLLTSRINETDNNNQSWTDASVKSPIHAYKHNIDKFSSPLYNKEKVWDKISGEINQHGIKFTGKKCDEKWRNLKKVYDKVIQNKRKTGSGPIHWPYFDEFHDIYFRDPRYNPIATVSSSGTLKRCVETISMDSETNSERFSPGEKKRKRAVSSYDIDKNKQKRHEERMTLKREMFEWFKNNYTKPKESPSEDILHSDEDSP
ncbi:unnamed protein product [Phaedon cochleariae]|uniref:Myb/SANT-like DNA-binding domain-containing protein n=1 Tax=Phaedon cochleariae TaxID=80249 RepID=A0A9N9SHM6_PHACE|nr:unnamed protein product [Phaedon cochleariae]